MASAEANNTVPLIENSNAGIRPDARSRNSAFTRVVDGARPWRNRQRRARRVENGAWRR
jgi:hypothetical protein